MEDINIPSVEAGSFSYLVKDYGLAYAGILRFQPEVIDTKNLSNVPGFDPQCIDVELSRFESDICVAYTKHV